MPVLLLYDPVLCSEAAGIKRTPQPLRETAVKYEALSHNQSICGQTVSLRVLSLTLTLAVVQPDENSQQSHWDSASRGRRGPCKQRHSYSLVWSTLPTLPGSCVLREVHSQVGYSYLKSVEGELFQFSVACALTFHSHRDDKFFPGCTLASVTSPGFSSALPAAAACFRHLWQTRKRTACFHPVRY